MKRAYSRITLTLPTFVILALRQLVADANGKHPEHRRKWTVSVLIEKWILDALTEEELRKVAAVSPGFRRAAKEWTREVGVSLHDLRHDGEAEAPPTVVLGKQPTIYMLTAVFRKAPYGWFIGQVEEIPAATSQGRSMEDAEASLREIVALGSTMFATTRPPR
jgi:hypothetical protein